MIHGCHIKSRRLSFLLYAKDSSFTAPVAIGIFFHNRLLVFVFLGVKNGDLEMARTPPRCETALPSMHSALGAETGVPGIESGSVMFRS